MVTKMTKNVLLVQDVPSNLIEEVILILKTEDKKINNKTREILIGEANEIINNCSKKLECEYEEFSKKEREKEIKRKKQKSNLIATFGILLFTITKVIKIGQLHINFLRGGCYGKDY